MNGEYVDFTKLIPRDTLLWDDESRLQLIIRDGKSFFIPANDAPSINGFTHWEKAF